MFEYVSKEFEIKNGEFRDARKVSPDKNGYYLVFYGFYYTGIPIEKSFEMAVWPFVVGHGWNCTISEDGTVNDKNKIEIVQPTYWAPLTVIEKTKIEIEKTKIEIEKSKSETKDTHAEYWDNLGIVKEGEQ